MVRRHQRHGVDHDAAGAGRGARGTKRAAGEATRPGGTARPSRAAHLLLGACALVGGQGRYHVRHRPRELRAHPGGFRVPHAR
jgi:hypothetical protein